jgi:hypothetical protein
MNIGARLVVGHRYLAFRTCPTSSPSRDAPSAPHGIDGTNGGHAARRFGRYDARSADRW